VEGETRDWLFSVNDHEEYSTYYSQHESSGRLSGEKILQSNLTKAEAMALLSLIGEPSYCGTVFGMCHYVYLDK
jgi:hypothetical protein